MQIPSNTYIYMYIYRKKHQITNFTSISHYLVILISKYFILLIPSKRGYIYTQSPVYTSTYIYHLVI